MLLERPCFDDLADEEHVGTKFGRVNHFALERDRELLHQRRVRDFSAARGEPGGSELVAVAPRKNAEVVGLGGLRLGGNVYGKRLPRYDAAEAVPSLLYGDGDAGGLRTADAAPCGDHASGFSFFVVHADEERGGRIHGKRFVDCYLHEISSFAKSARDAARIECIVTHIAKKLPEGLLLKFEKYVFSVRKRKKEAYFRWYLFLFSPQYTFLGLSDQC